MGRAPSPCSRVITITVSDASPVPPFEQVRSQIAAAIAVGGIKAGSQLPTVRQLASDLGLAPNTVARAYRALEEAGLVETRGRAGTTVADVQAPRRRPPALLAAAADYLARARQLGASDDEAIGALHAVIVGPS